MAAHKQANATWDGSLTEGGGTATLASGVAGELPMSWRVRTTDGERATSPEELIAAAHASCFAMALSNELAQAGATDVHLDTQATVTFETDGGARIASSALRVRASLQGLDEAGFRAAADRAKGGCPVSAALADSVEITLDASLA